MYSQLEKKLIVFNRSRKQQGFLPPNMPLPVFEFELLMFCLDKQY